MRSKVIASGVLTVALVAASASYAKDPIFDKGLYVSGSLGFLVPQDVDGSDSGIDFTVEYDNGYQLTGALGYKYGNGLRAEAEIGFGSTEFDSVSGNGTTVDLSADVDILSVMANVYYDFNAGSRFSPYVGGGVGFARIDVGDLTANLGGTTVTASGDESTEFTAAGEIGLSIAVSDSVVVAPAYRYTWLDDGDNGFDDDTAHTFKIGLRYSW